jgi:threonine dehydratase
MMIKEYRKRDGVSDFVISSSGNAALAAMLTVFRHNQNNPSDKLTLQVFVGVHIDAEKKKRLESYTSAEIILRAVDRPKQQAFALAAGGTVKNLRQSTDALALRGYYTLAEELTKIPELQAVFLPTSSGTTAVGIGEAFRSFGLPIAVHIVQTSACHPLADGLDAQPAANTDTSIASAIVDRVAHRREDVHALIKESGGGGWVVSDADITAAIALIKEITGIDVSPNSALSVAGLQKAIAAGASFTGPVVCVFTGA